ncbi:MAG: SpoIIE family protein phosphatase [Patescibacteria group bacterium]|nr:SpoIIE family protein phosphatase [Patescibacteria group bacterium]
MTFIKQSLIWKLIIHFLILLGLIAGFVYYLGYVKEPFISVELAAIIIGAVLVLYLFWVYFVVVKPMRSILKQMKAMVTGRSFKKVYTKRTDEIGILAFFFNKITESLSKISGTVKEGKRMAEELSVAARLQTDILPEKPPVVPGLEVVAKTRSAVEVGGDNFDFVDFDGGKKTLMYIGDVTGHGVPAALVMTMVHTLVSIFSELRNNIYDIVVSVNKQLKSRIRSTMFMTMVVLSWDHEAQKMTYVGAGHEYLLVYRADSGECESIKAGGIALGMVPDNSKIVKEQELKLNVGDVVVLYTDGIVEAKNEQEEMFGLSRLIENIKRFAAEYSPEGISYHTATEFSRFVGNALQADDISLIVIKNVGKGKEQAADNMRWGQGEGKKI